MQNAARLRVCSWSQFSLLKVQLTSIGTLTSAQGSQFSTISVGECCCRTGCRPLQKPVNYIRSVYIILTWSGNGHAHAYLSYSTFRQHKRLSKQYLTFYSPGDLHRHFGATSPSLLVESLEISPFSYGQLREKFSVILRLTGAFVARCALFINKREPDGLLTSPPKS